MLPEHGIVRFLTCGSVDDGKSTLIGHLLALTGNLYADQFQALEQESGRIGTMSDGLLDYSLLLDGLLAEREQGITIDVAYRYFTAGNRKFIVADTPGHEQYIRNMATGASQCSAAVILVDATQGVLPQTRRHTLICALMGVRHILFAVNKMDRAGWQQGSYVTVQEQCESIVHKFEQYCPSSIRHTTVPVSALLGDNLTSGSGRMAWYTGPTVLDWLLTVPEETYPPDAPLRLPVQYVTKLSWDSDQWQPEAQKSIEGKTTGIWRGYTGTVCSGTLKQDDQILILPSGVRTTVEQIRVGHKAVNQAVHGTSVSLSLHGEQDIKRGDLICHPEQRPEQSDLFKARLVWMDEKPLYAGRSYHCIGVWGETTAELLRIRGRIDLSSCQHLAVNHLEPNDIGEVELRLGRSIPFDPYHTNRETGGLILVDRLSNTTAACGMILHSLRRADNVHWHAHQVTRDVRAELKRQRSRVIWLTGLSGSGKSTIANALEQRLVEMGNHTMLLDGDNIRHGLNKDLGFTEADRIENIRRIGEVARLLADAGLIVITAFISPYRAERDLVKTLLPDGEFVEVYINTPLEECERRDPKGLYQKARQGQIPNFTGINAPYEPPENPAIVIDTAREQLEASVQRIIQYLYG